MSPAIAGLMRILILTVIIFSGCLPQRAPEVVSRHEPSTAVNVRVYETGRRLIAANPLTGVDVSFQVVGHPELLIFHRDHLSVFVSDTLVEKCADDDELAALLCTELGRIVAEKRNLARMGYADGLVTIPSENALDAGKTAADPIRVAELKLREADRDASKDLTDPVKISRELMKSANFDVTAFERIEPLMKTVNKDREMLRQFGAGSEPKWSR